MIEAATPTQATREVPAPDPEFRVDPQDQLPFVPTSIEVFRQDDQTEVHWASSSAPAANEMAKSLLDQMVARARHEAERHPNSARALVNLGTSLLNAGFLSDAAEQFEQAYELDGRSVSALAHLARVRLLQGRPQDAAALASELRRIEPSNALGAILAASAALSQERPSDSVEALKEAAELTPDDPTPQYLLGLVLLGEQRPTEAMPYLRKAVRLNPRSATIQHALGVAYGMKGDWSKAIRAFKTALSLAPRQRQSILALSRAFLQRSIIEAAISILLDWVGHEPHDREAQELLAHAYSLTGDARAAKRHLSFALRSLQVNDYTNVDRARLMNNIGVCSGQLADHQDASEWFFRSVQVLGTAVGTLNLAKAYRELERYDLAHDVLASWLAQDPGDVEARLLFAAVAGELGRYSEAIATLQNLIDSGQASASAYACLGWLLSDESRDYEAASRILLEARHKFGADLSIANNLAYVSLMAGKAQLAAEVMDSVPKPDITDSVYLTATLGLLRLHEGHVDAAAELYQAAETVARQRGRKTLAKTVRQKMHLEFARSLGRAGDHTRALEHIKRGLAVQGRKSYHADLRSAYEQLLQSPQPSRRLEE